MEKTELTPEIRKTLLKFQRNEITEFHIYKRIGRRTSGENGKILEKIADDELRHYREWKELTGKEVKPNRWMIFFYSLMSRIFGLTFAVKMLERGEEGAEEAYGNVAESIPRAKHIAREEWEHEQKLIAMIDEERIGYIGSMVLGLNDALVELTGALAGLTLALQNTRMIGLAGLITGIAASLSMSASEYLSQKSESEGKDPLRASFYTGVAYIFTVVFLVMPYFIFQSYFLALGVTLGIGLIIILIFTYFVAVVKDLSYRKFLGEMVLISLGVAVISFGIGWLARALLHVEI